MRYEVLLRLHEDDATGEWGLAHSNAIGKFNAFWSADGIFHDVFEHYVEDTHKYFTGRYAFQLYGEMCASGHGIAYRDIGIDNFRYRNLFNERDFTADTFPVLESWTYEGCEGYPDFGIVDCAVPRQTDVNSYNFDHWFNEYQCKVEALKEKYAHKELRQIKLYHIRNCYRLGFRMAEKIIGVDQNSSYHILDKFLTDWNSIIQHKPHELYISESDYGIWGFKFVVTNNGKLKVKTTVLDGVRNEHPIESLIY